MNHDFLFETIARLQERRTPNFFRLYLNPFVAQTCFALDRLAQKGVRNLFSVAEKVPDTFYQSFLANSFEEAVSGAIKLARYAGNLEGRPGNGLIFDRDQRLASFAGSTLRDGAVLTFVPGVTIIDEQTPVPAGRVGWVVVFPGEMSAAEREKLRDLIENQAPLVIACVSQSSLAACAESGWHLPPDIVVFDESFVRRQVPFAAFSARRSLYDVWNRRGKAAFHSTTFQPNSISTLHFMRCLQADNPDFHARHREEFDRLGRDEAACAESLKSLYQPALAKTIKTLGLDTFAVQARGHYVHVKGRKIFDGVSGIACSLRGHHPPGYLEELKKLEVDDYHQAACDRLERLTGLGCLLPAVSGASAVESALRIGLAVQHPQRCVLALKGGFGGKTLFALTGTANPSYKVQLDPLYEHVIYVDPFGPDAIARLTEALDRHPIGIVQLELIQGVGGVRAVPDQVVRFLDAERTRRGYLLFVDEVQTGMFRTGPFARSRAVGIQPDLMTIGKGAADMMFPFSATLYSRAVAERLEQVAPGLADERRRRLDYEMGYKTLINALDRSEELGLTEQVARSSARLAELLTAGLAGARSVKQVRAFGLLIAIELDVSGWPERWFRKQAHALYILNLLRRREFPLFLGFCQYEPHVLKLTPPLTTTPAEVEQLGAALVSTLRRPFWQLLPGLCGVVGKSWLRRLRGVRPLRRSKHEHAAH